VTAGKCSKPHLCTKLYSFVADTSVQLAQSCHMKVDQLAVNPHSLDHNYRVTAITPLCHWTGPVSINFMWLKLKQFQGKSWSELTFGTLLQLTNTLPIARTYSWV